jgi:hypothetical protein
MWADTDVSSRSVIEHVVESRGVPAQAPPQSTTVNSADGSAGVAVMVIDVPPGYEAVHVSGQASLSGP